MDLVTRSFERVLAFLVNIMSSGNELPVVIGATLLFVFGSILLYKKGPWHGIPFTLAGILMVVIAIITKTLFR